MLAAVKPTVGTREPLGRHPHHRGPGHARAPWPAPSPTRPSSLAPWRGRSPIPRTRPRPPARRRRTTTTRPSSTPTACRARASASPGPSTTTRFRCPGRTGGAAACRPRQRASWTRSSTILKAQGATIVDPADIPSVVDPDPADNLLLSGRSSVLDYGMKRDFNAWLATLGPAAPVKTLTELREWNLAHRAAGSMKYGQARLDESDAIDLERGPGAVRGRPGPGPPPQRRARHRRGDGGAPAGRAALPGPEQRRHRGHARLSHGDRAVRLRAQRRSTRRSPTASTPGPSPFGVSFTGRRVQRAPAPGAGLRLRAGDEAAGAPAGDAVGWSSETPWHGRAWHCVMVRV